MYKNFIFDFYGTLADIRTNEWKPYLWRKMSEFYTSMGAAYTGLELRRNFRQLEKESIHRLKREAADLGRQDFLVEPDLTGVFQKLFQDKGVLCERGMAGITAAFFRTLSRQFIKKYDGVDDTLRKLRNKGKGLYLLSNAQSDFTRPELEMLGLSKAFDGILISSEEGCKKPCGAFFNLLIERYNLNPSECLMVGNDEYSDISGAKNVGMDSLYIHTETSPEPEGGVTPTYSVMDGNWKSVAKILLGESD